MPVTIRQGTVNFKDSSNEYVPINAVAQQTSEAEIAAIQSLSNTEKSAIQSLSTTEQTAIQTKGTETLASIPNDYTTLSEEVDDLKSAVDEIGETITDNIKNTTTYNWAIKESDGSVIARSAQRSIIMPCKANTTYTIKDPKGNRLVVGAMATLPANGSTFTHYADLSSSLSNASFTTGDGEVYMMVNYYYTTDAQYTEQQALDALEVYHSEMIANDKEARAEFASIADYTLSWLNGKKISIIADSISSFDASGYKIDGYETYYPHGDVTSVTDMWWDYVAKNSGAVIEKNASYASSRATNTDNTRPDFYARANSTILGSPDIIFVQIGTNDSTYNVSIGGYDYTTATADMSEAYFRNAYIKGVKTLMTNFPNATIVLLVLKMKDAYAQSIKNIAKSLGVSCVFIQDYTTTQGDHPDAAGMRKIAVQVMDWAMVAMSDAAKQDERDAIGAVGNEIYTGAIRKSNNLYNPDNCVLGAALETSGNITAAGTYEDRCVIRDIPVNGLSNILIAVEGYTGTGTTGRYCWYDKNGSAITLSGQTNAAIGGFPLYGIDKATSVSVPETAYTMAFQLYYEHCELDAAGKPKCMVQSGTVYTGREIYGESVVITVQPKDVYVCAKDSPEKYRVGADYYCTGENDELVLQTALDAVGQVGTLWVAPGTYSIDSFPEQTDGQYNAIQYKVKRSGSVKQQRVRIRCYDQTPMRENGYSIINHCATLKVSSTCYSALSSDTQYSVIGVEDDGEGDRVWNGACFDVSGVGIMIPGNQKKIIAFDAWNAFCIMMERCMATAIPDNNMPEAAGNENCVGIKCTKGSNFGQCSQLTSCAMYGFGQGIAVSGEHYVLTNCKTIYNKYGFTFNWYGDNNAGYTHPNTLINCCSEMDFNYPYFGYNGQGQPVTFIDFNMEYRNASAALGGELAQEATPGSWRGTINYSVKTYASDGYGTNTRNNPAFGFWKSGHGTNVKTINDVQKQIVTTTERNSYAAHEMQRVYDTTAEKFYTYINGEWVEG